MINAVTIRKMLYIAISIAPAIIWLGLCFIGIQMLPALFSKPLSGAIGIASLIGLISIPLSFIVIVSLPVLSEGGKIIATSLVGPGLICLIIALLFLPPEAGSWPLLSGLALLGVATAILAELWAPTKSGPEANVQ